MCTSITWADKNVALNVNPMAVGEFKHWVDRRLGRAFGQIVSEVWDDSPDGTPPLIQQGDCVVCVREAEAPLNSKPMDACSISTSKVAFLFIFFIENGGGTSMQIFT